MLLLNSSDYFLDDGTLSADSKISWFYGSFCSFLYTSSNRKGPSRDCSVCMLGTESRLFFSTFRELQATTSGTSKGTVRSWVNYRPSQELNGSLCSGRLTQQTHLKIYLVDTNWKLSSAQVKYGLRLVVNNILTHYASMPIIFHGFNFRYLLVNVEGSSFNLLPGLKAHYYLNTLQLISCGFCEI